MSATVGSTTTTTNFIYDNSMLVRERRNNANYATYLTGARGPEYRRDDTSGNVSWYVYDGLGSVVAEVKGDGTGAVTSSRKYDVFGSVRGGSNPSGTSKQKFVGGLGHVSDDETGYVYMQARYMDPITGRFVSQDPARHGANWLTYCGNNPINMVDADGRLTEQQQQVLQGIAEIIIGCFLLGMSCLVPVALAGAGYIFGFDPGAVIDGGMAFAKLFEVAMTLIKRPLTGWELAAEQLQTAQSLAGGRNGRTAAAILGYILVIKGFMDGIGTDT